MVQSIPKTKNENARKIPPLQVALDLMNLPRALQIADEAVKGGATWIEAGTPLIKAEGMNAVRELTQHMTNPGDPHWRAMGRTIGYLKNKEKHELVYQCPI